MYDQSQKLFCGLQRSQLLGPKCSEKQDARQKKFVEELELDKRTCILKKARTIRGQGLSAEELRQANSDSRRKFAKSR
jgi:hypothetical protein